MKYYIFRNQTIEPFFSEKEIGFSGYDDISNIPADVERFIWFYQVPFNFNSQQLSLEVGTYIDKLRMVVSQIVGREIWVFTLSNLFRCQMIGNDYQVAEAINSFNSQALELSKENSNIRIIDFSEFTSSYPSEQLVNWKFYFISQTQLNTKLAKDFSIWFSKKEEELALKRKKCLVLDLDNTLWGGILGEDGVTGIKIGGDYPGKAFLYWQQALLELSKTGVILTICSKNNEQDVLEAWEKNPFMVLRKEHFSAWRINWQDKATNIQELAQELNIGLDSMVFVDDNPTERALIAQMLPMVSVPDFPSKPFELIAFFRQMVDHYFRIYAITDEDRKKTDQYKANAQRAAERSKFVDMDSYLRSLDIELSILLADEFNISRIAQMTQKTNQFNLTTHRMTEQEVKDKLSEGWLIYCLSVSDRFGDNGITGAIFITPTHHIDNLLLSCRILGKGIEQAFVSFILNRLHAVGVESVTARYLPTKKNGQTADFYDRLGFKSTRHDSVGKDYQIKLTEDLPIKDYYQIKTK